MTRVLFLKLLRDIRVALVLVCALLFLFEMLWARVTYTISERLLGLAQINAILPVFLDELFKGPGKIIQQLMGGDAINLTKGLDTLSIGYVHPVIQTVLCIWAMGRASGAVAGEIDRGTMELLLAQPVPRNRLILAHFLVDLLVIPLLCMSMWFGSLVGLQLVGLLDHSNPNLRVDPLRTLPSLWSHAFLIFCHSGLTLWLSAANRFRYRALGLAVFISLVMFLVNLLGQLWTVIEWLRPFTVFYYFNPQPMILESDWYAHGMIWLRLAVLFGLGVLGYLGALWTFCRRDLPAPL